MSRNFAAALLLTPQSWTISKPPWSMKRWSTVLVVICCSACPQRGGSAARKKCLVAKSTIKSPASVWSTSQRPPTPQPPHRSRAQRRRAVRPSSMPTMIVVRLGKAESLSPNHFTNSQQVFAQVDDK